MKLSLSLAAALLATSYATGCATARSPLTGIIYSDVQSGHFATSNQAGNRTGQACATSILGAIARGDASIEAARRAGGINLITSVDESAESILGIYAKYCVTVRGR